MPKRSKQDREWAHYFYVKGKAGESSESDESDDYEDREWVYYLYVKGSDSESSEYDEPDDHQKRSKMTENVTSTTSAKKEDKPEVPPPQISKSDPDTTNKVDEEGNVIPQPSASQAFDLLFLNPDDGIKEDEKESQVQSAVAPEAAKEISANQKKDDGVKELEVEPKEIPENVDNAGGGQDEDYVVTLTIPEDEYASGGPTEGDEIYLEGGLEGDPQGEKLVLKEAIKMFEDEKDINSLDI